MKWLVIGAVSLMAIPAALPARFAAAEDAAPSPSISAPGQIEQPSIEPQSATEMDPGPTDEYAYPGLCPLVLQRRAWAIDFILSPMVGSRTSYQFGTYPPDGGPQYAPLSKLDWDLDSVWCGLRFALERETWDVHAQWLTPSQKIISGHMRDYDWVNPADPSELDSLSSSETRWNDGQMAEIQGECRAGDLFCFEVWPLAGFKYERFDITAYNTTQLVSSPGFVPAGTFFSPPAIAFSQQYYVAYFGAQFRTLLNHDSPLPVVLTFQADGGPAWGYDVDHHLLREGDRYTMDNTFGGAFHFALIGELRLNEMLSVGIQADHMEIRTSGTHHQVNVPLGEDYTWSNGVQVNSDQTMISGFVRARF